MPCRMAANSPSKKIVPASGHGLFCTAQYFKTPSPGPQKRKLCLCGSGFFHSLPIGVRSRHLGLLAECRWRAIMTSFYSISKYIEVYIQLIKVLMSLTSDCSLIKRYFSRVIKQFLAHFTPQFGVQPSDNSMNEDFTCRRDGNTTLRGLQHAALPKIDAGLSNPAAHGGCHDRRNRSARGERDRGIGAFATPPSASPPSSSPPSGPPCRGPGVVLDERQCVDRTLSRFGPDVLGHRVLLRK